MHKLIGTLALLALTGCTTTRDTAQDKQVEALTTCEKIDALVKGHQAGFPQLRMTGGSSAGIAQVWPARYHLVGNDCQVWQWGKGKFSYVCSLQEPGQELAMAHLEKARDITRQCLDASWAQATTARDMGVGSRIQFSKPGVDTVISLVAAETPTVFKDEWRTYYLVGDPQDIK